MPLSNKATLILVSTATAFLGSGAGYLIAEKRLAEKFDARLEEETDKVRAFYQGIGKTQTPEEVVKTWNEEDEQELDKIEETVSKYIGRQDDGEPQVAYHKIRKSTIVDTVGESVVEVEAQEVLFPINQAPELPAYPITFEEFEAGERNYVNVTLTYYEKDGILAGDDDESLDLVDHLGEQAAVTIKNWSMFGNLLSDENTVHIRNNKFSLDYEVVRSPGSYQEEVLGEVWEGPITRPSGRGE